MTKSNLYYTTVWGRKSAPAQWTLLMFVLVLSWPRMLLEVFIRKNFGERYFSLITGIAISIFLFFLPIAIDKFSPYGGDDTMAIIFKNFTWYLFLAGFVYCCFQRQKEIEHKPGVFDFAKFSLSTGIPDTRFYAIKIPGRETTTRVVSTIVEPLFFLGIGILLTMCLQKLGILLIVCSLCYSLGYHCDYLRGDHFIMDKIDEMICNEELVSSFVDGRRPEETRGFESYGKRPSNPDFRRKVVNSIFEEHEPVDAY